MVTEPVRAEALRLAGGGDLPAYVYDLPALRAHAAGVRGALAGTAELYYAVKANPAAEILRALVPYVDGFEVASGGELAHVREVAPDLPIAFSGPGKTDAELALALTPGVHRLHVESPRELARLIALGAPADVLLRANPDLPGEDTRQAAASPFGMDQDGLAACLPLLAAAPHIRVRGLHTHLTWAQHDAPAMAALARRVTSWALPWLRAHLPGLTEPELDLGGGMGVDYRAPDQVFDWKAYAAALPATLPATGARLRVEPGRSLTAYHGWYVTDVLDVKRNHGRDYAVLRGGTHHLRTPVARGHDQPFTVLHRAVAGPALTGPATLVGQLCTPRDVLARDVPVTGLRPGDLVVFELAGAYAWNLSHHEFLMHPPPRFRYLD
ncbi:alanine racemase [Nonomuraea sp. NPDC049486]|uniref:alanine racemase n=1 Tax=Nonomuraea sp. NPDC049486 TaxID=3155773 RepID=UPI00342514BA